MIFRRAACFLFLFLMSLTSVTVTAEESTVPVVTIKGVELKNVKGEWIMIIEPDRRFDPTQDELGVTLVNNGRVPAGLYVNFRITVSEFQNRQSKQDETWITLKSDLEPVFRVAPHSFIGVWFHLNWKGDTASSDVKDAVITVDESTQTLTGDKFHFLKTSGLLN